MNTKPLIEPTAIEESKISPRMAAPKSLAPLASKSKAQMSTLDLNKVGNLGMNNNNLDSKLSNLPNQESENETEFESNKTVMPHGKLDEIQSLLGQERSMAEL